MKRVRRKWAFVTRNTLGRNFGEHVRKYGNSHCNLHFICPSDHFWTAGATALSGHCKQCAICSATYCWHKWGGRGLSHSRRFSPRPWKQYVHTSKVCWFHTNLGAQRFFITQLFPVRVLGHRISPLLNQIH